MRFIPVRADFLLIGPNKECHMIKELEFDEDYLKLLSKPWQKFFKKFAQIEILSVSEWKPVHQLAYFTVRYQRHFGARFSLSLNGAPCKCSEVFLVNKISGMLGTSNQKTIKEYIDWVFDNKIIPNNKKIRSIGFLANSKFCNEFNTYFVEKNRIYRHTELPVEYKQIAQSLNIPVNTFGDLAFAKSAIDLGSDQNCLYQSFFHELYKIGFEFDMIQSLR